MVYLLTYILHSLELLRLKKVKKKKSVKRQFIALITTLRTITMQGKEN